MHDMVERFRSAKAAMTAFWSIGEDKFHGVLSWKGDRPVLTISIQIEGGRSLSPEDADHPLLNATKPPLQPNFVARVRGLGLVTLEACARFSSESDVEFSSGRSLVSISFQPTRLWIGDEFGPVATKAVAADAYDGRLKGLFREPGFKKYRAEELDPGTAQKLKSPTSVWAFHDQKSAVFPLGETGISMQVTSIGSEGFSATEGSRISTVTRFRFRSDKPLALEQFLGNVWELERLFSTFVLERHAFQTLIFHGEEGNRVALAWQLGDKSEHFEAPMFHQVLFDFSDDAVCGKIIDKWYRASPTEKLSRWLFARSLTETENGVARFIAVSQAFEVMGRALGPTQRMDRQQMRHACKTVRDSLSGAHFPAEFVERCVQLISSSNQASYRSVLEYMIGNAVRKLRLGNPEDVTAMCKESADVRNAIVHMSDKNEGELEHAFLRVNKLSLRLCFWFAIVQAAAIGVPPKNASEFLFNNRNARHGLPNELLEQL